MSDIYVGIVNLCPECPGGVCHIIGCNDCEQVFERHLTLSRELEVA